MYHLQVKNDIKPSKLLRKISAIEFLSYTHENGVIVFYAAAHIRDTTMISCCSYRFSSDLWEVVTVEKCKPKRIVPRMKKVEYPNFKVPNENTTIIVNTESPKIQVLKVLNAPMVIHTDNNETTISEFTTGLRVHTYKGLSKNKALTHMIEYFRRNSVTPELLQKHLKGKTILNDISKITVNKIPNFDIGGV